jgi:hypothetical protein
MDLKQFEAALLEALEVLPYVAGVKINRRTEISLQALVGLKKEYILSVFYNEAYYVMSFSLIFHQKRIWGIDRDNRVGWHIHPLGNPEEHLPAKEMSIAQIIEEMDIVCRAFFDS